AGLESAGQVKALLHHDPARPVGHMETVRVGVDGIEAAGVLSVAQHAGEILAAQQQGFEWEASIGATIGRGTVEQVPAGKAVRVNGREFRGPLAVARKTRLREISFVGVGAGENTAALAASLAVPFTDPTMADDNKVPADDATKASADDAASKATGSGDTSQILAELQTVRASLKSDMETIKAEAKKLADDRETLKRERLVESVHRIAAQYGCRNDEILADLRQKAAAGDVAETDVELQILRASRAQRVAGFQPLGGTNGAPATAHVIEAAICLTNGWEEDQLQKHFDEKTCNEAISAQFAGFGVRGLMVEYLKGKGHDVIGGRLTDEDIKAGIGYAGQDTIRASAGGFSTISLPGILGNVARKEVLRGYDAFRQAILKIARRGSTTDYKPFFMYRLNTGGLLEQIGPDGELKSIDLTEDDYQSRVYPFGRKLAITDVMFRNDDASAFSDLARLFGVTASRSVEKHGFTTLLSDQANFWTTVKGNRLAAGAASALSLDSLGDAYALFLSMKDSTDQPIGLDPRYLLTAPTDAVLAGSLNRSTTINLAVRGATDAIVERTSGNPFQGMFEPLHSPYLANTAVQNANGTQWLLAADPAITAPIAVAFLDGQSAPRIRPWEAIPGRLGMQWDVSMSFGFNLHDERASVLSPGA
ncbi:MAG: hypothetical protein WBC44_15085, partial [Planctomycetaceae bacterium]